MTRLWVEGIPLQVRGETWQPQQLLWNGQAHPVAEVTRHWRVRGDWWRETMWRDYFKLATTTGLLVVIYHDLHSGDWYLQRLYD